jgi:parvulin-like peptidyl-prolyl isomerase
MANNIGGRVAKESKKSAKSEAEGTATLDEQRKEVLKKARVHKKPLNIGRHKVLAMTAVILVVLLVGFMATIGYLIYGQHSTNSIVYRVSRVVPFPIAKVNSSFISYGSYLFNVRTTQHLYKSQSAMGGQSEPVDFSSDEGKQLLAEIENNALNDVEQRAIVQQLAKENDVKVDKQVLNDRINEYIEQNGGDKKFKEALSSYYGWNMNDFRAEYKYQLLKEELQKKLSQGKKQQVEEIRNRAVAGEDFAALATQFTQDTSTKEAGGDLGFVNQDTNFVPEFKQAALNLEPGQVSEIVETQFGFHIIKVTEKNDSGSKVSHILISYEDIENLIAQKLAEAKVSTYVKLPEPPQQQPVQAQPAT